MRLYFDGVLVTHQTTNVRAAFLDPSVQPALGLGNTPYDGGFPFIGLIDELVLYSRALSPAEVQSLALTVNFPPATVRLQDVTNVAGSLLHVPLILVANGNETALGFSVNFNPTRLTYSGTVAGAGFT